MLTLATKNILQWFYLNRETDNSNQWKIATNKQKKTVELVHNCVVFLLPVFHEFSKITLILDINVRYNKRPNTNDKKKVQEQKNCTFNNNE